MEQVSRVRHVVRGDDLEDPPERVPLELVALLFTAFSASSDRDSSMDGGSLAARRSSPGQHMLTSVPVLIPCSPQSNSTFLAWPRGVLRVQGGVGRLARPLGRHLLNIAFNHRDWGAPLFE